MANCIIGENKLIELNISMGSICYKLVKVDPGRFIMGGTSTFDSPEKIVQIDKAFYIGKYPVTQKFWKEVMREEVPSKYIGANRPVDEVLEADSNKFIKTLNKLTGMNFSIPTEEQWEFAARGGVYSKGYKLSGGNEPSELFGKNEVEDGYQSITYDVGIFKSNELGLYDMNSNVSEWCIKDKNRNILVLKGGVLGYEGGLIWDACSIAEEIRETADSYTPNKGIRIVLNI